MTIFLKALTLYCLGTFVLSTPHMSVSEAVKESDLVFSGECLRVDTIIKVDSVEWRFQQDTLSKLIIREALPVQMKFLQVRIKVDSTFKGTASDTMKLCVACRNLPDSSCFNGGTIYQEGRRYIVYGRVDLYKDIMDRYSLPTSKDVVWELSRSCGYNTTELSKLKRILNSLNPK